MSDAEQELAQELYDRRDEPGEWSDDAVSVDVRPSGMQVLSFRLPLEELESLQRAAEEAGETVSEYIRGALAIRLHGTPIGPAVEITSGAGTLTVRSHIVTKSPNENSAVDFISDFPPRFVAVTS